MIGLEPFRLHRPRTVEAAVRVLSEHRGDARALAGGTDLLVNLRQGLASPSHVVALGGIESLRGLTFSPDGALRIGALTTVAEMASNASVRGSFPVLSRAAANVSGPTLRAMATVGGNLCLDTRCHWYNQSFFWRQACGFCLKKDGQVCHVAPGSSLCWAAFAGDLAPALLVLGAEIIIASARGVRCLLLERFYVEDGLKRFDLAADEIITEVLVPPGRAGLRGVYGKLRIRGALDYPLAGVAAAARVDAAGKFRQAALALTGVSPRPFLVEGASELLDGQSANDEDAIERVAHLARRLANPMKTTSAPPPAHRRLRVGLLARDALRELAAG